jgi:hypothetical protein
LSFKVFGSIQGQMESKALALGILPKLKLWTPIVRTAFKPNIHPSEMNQ